MQRFSVALVANDADSDALTFSVLRLPAWANFSIVTADLAPLLDLDKYRIYWGTGSGDYPNSVTIDAGMTTYVVDNLAVKTVF